jgi:hypothetical protein
MIRLPGGILNGGQDILVFEVRVILQYLVKRGSGAQQFKHVAHANSHAPDAGATTTLRVVDCYTVEAIWRHDVTYKTSV